MTELNFLSGCSVQGGHFRSPASPAIGRIIKNTITNPLDSSLLNASIIPENKSPQEKNVKNNAMNVFLEVFIAYSFSVVEIHSNFFLLNPGFKN